MNWAALLGPIPGIIGKKKMGKIGQHISTGLQDLGAKVGIGPIPNMLGLSGDKAIGNGLLGHIGGEHGLGSLGKFLTGDKAHMGQIPRYTPEQQDILHQLLGQGMANSDISGQEDLARKRFSEDTIPSIAERFVGMGGGMRGGGFQHALGGASADLEAQLKALRSGQGMQQLQLGLQPSFESMYSPASPGFLQHGLESALPMLLKSLFGGMI